MTSLIKYLSAVHQKGLTQFIAICGAADLGKSTLARKLVDQLEERQLTADILSMDSYLIPRTQRNALGISGYDSKAYEWEKLIEDVKMLQLGTSIHFREYSHKEGVANGSWKNIKPVGLVMIDGLHSMHQRLRPYLSTSIFIETSDKHLIQLRREADLSKRGLSSEQSQEVSEKEFRRYKKHIAPYAKDAKLLLCVSESWEYSLSINGA